ncbi:MAG: hypothetical protein Q7U77_10895 [Sediminibacterium sp.]|uniref:hypothetical protein n=1 Tax=Sediminibacterium sp. TaxID=1917865 RepID=UPI002726184E|nr:hypothetical protein [Sediminibacterium sp.]MDO8997123.1 hypothetical protein [Sediminibacterium sp.]
MQPTNPLPQPIEQEEEFSLSGQLLGLWKLVLYALSKWRLLALAAVLGALLGLGYYFLKPVIYTAHITFVVEESKSAGGGGSLMSALAGQFGVDIGGLSGTSGVLAGDNVLQLLKSRSLIKKTLLTPFTNSVNDKGTARSLADEYARVYGLDKKWLNSRKVGRAIAFKPGVLSLPRTEDSLLQSIVKKILEKELIIAKPDKKLGFFEMSTSMRSEQLSALFCTRLLKTTTDFYIDTKTRRLVTNVQRLQVKADSLLYALNKKTYSSADANRMLLDINPVYAAPAVNAEMSARDKIIQGTIYADIVKNLEISKTSLIQETPTVQVVDEPEFPLPDNASDWWLAALAGAALLVLIAGVIIIALKK